MHLTAAAIQALEGEHKTHFLNPQAQRHNVSLGDAVGLKNLGVHKISVEPGCYSTELHYHHYEEECLYVLSGQAQLTLGEETRNVGPGDFIGCPLNGVAHALYNNGQEPLVCLVIGQRLEQDISDYPRLGQRLYRHSGHWDLVEQQALKKIK
ncbi:cupin domain-containing protein [Marinospirillum perlucidum]|uniref:cupin domain-containing protein n=1 Tax=Marinospirillum perlucidum TaxID=1982602 RepID=UPI000DF27F9C|nr:cupin domain-containing protein [Marinospirillum perlucidum]